MRWVADLLYLIAGLLYLPVALYNALVVGKNRSGWGERFGFLRTFDKSKPRIWLHAVSLGEVNCTPQLLAELRARLPDYDFVVSTTTDTGFARAVKLYGRDQVFRCPLDFSLVMGRVLRRLRPMAIVLVELELWYNMVRMATRRGVPVMVINGRLTERSARRFRILGPAGRSMFADLKWVGAQDEAIAARFVELGVPCDRVDVTSSLKWDTAVVSDHIEGEDALADAMGIDRQRPLWVCGSTGPGEEEIVLEAYRRVLRGSEALAQSTQGDSGKTDSVSAPQLAIVPRKPERFEEVARLIGRAGYACIRRSERSDGTVGEAPQEPAVMLGDTMGELRKFYSLADVTFVGRSLVPMGGSDPMEVAALGKPVVVGPHTGNFRLPIEALATSDAVRVVSDGRELGETVTSLLRMPELREELGSRARAVVTQHQGATNRTADGIMRVLGDASPAPECSTDQNPRPAAKPAN